MADGTDTPQGPRTARVIANAYLDASGVQWVTAHCSSCRCKTSVRLGLPQPVAVRRAAMHSCFVELRAQGCSHVTNSGPAS